MKIVWVHTTCSTMKHSLQMILHKSAKLKSINHIKTVVNALVTCKLDYCSGLFIGLSLDLAQIFPAKIQPLGSSMKRVKGTIASMQKALCWLSIRFQTIYKTYYS